MRARYLGRASTKAVNSPTSAGSMTRVKAMKPATRSSMIVKVANVRLIPLRSNVLTKGANRDARVSPISKGSRMWRNTTSSTKDTAAIESQKAMLRETFVMRRSIPLELSPDCTKIEGLRLRGVRLKGGAGPELEQRGLALAAGVLVVRRDAVLADIEAVELGWGAPRLLERKDALPVSLHIHHGPVIQGSGVQRLAESAKVRFAIICVFTFGVSVMNENAKAYSTAHGRPLQHFEVAIRVAKGGDRTAADVLVDADRLASLVIDEIHLRQTKQDGSTITHFEPRLNRGADHLVGRHPVDALRPRPHELDAAAGYNEGHESVGA